MSETKLQNTDRYTKRLNQINEPDLGATLWTTTSTTDVNSGIYAVYTADDRDETVKVTIDIMFYHQTSGWFKVSLYVNGDVQTGVFYCDVGTLSWQRVSRTFVFNVNKNCSARCELWGRVSAGTGNLHTSSTAYNPTFIFESYPRQDFLL